MSTARFSIGIDLGTTNSALAYAPLNGDAPPTTLPTHQWETPETLVEVPMLPSFLYLPEDALAQQLSGKVPETKAWIVGRLARRRAAEMPGRVVRSAKSWLGHHAADRAAPMLEQPKHLLAQQLEELATAGPTDAEVARARAFAIGEHALRHERNRDQAKWISWSEAAGLGVSMDQDFPSHVAAVTKEQVHEAAKQLFKNYALVITLPPPS